MKTIITLCIFLFFIQSPVLVKAQLIKVTGSVSNEKDGSLLENVTIYETNSSIGTISDQQGNFQLMLKTGKARLNFDFNGYEECRHSLVLKSDTTLSVQLSPLEFKDRQKGTGFLTRAKLADNNNRKKTPR